MPRSTRSQAANKHSVVTWKISTFYHAQNIIEKAIVKVLYSEDRKSVV